MNNVRPFLDWLISTDGGLLCRIAVGVAIFSVLAIVDVMRHGHRATRWREYLFLVAVVTIAIIYGVANDLLTCRISWEYFLYGKGLTAILGSTTPPDPSALSWEAGKIGLKATWSAGLIMGVAMLIANNPSRRLPQLRYRQLLCLIPIIFLMAAATAAITGLAGYHGWLVRISSDFAEMTRNNEFRPYRFMAVYGIHLGDYIGAAVGTVFAVMRIRARRKSLRIADEPA